MDAFEFYKHIELKEELDWIINLLEINYVDYKVSEPSTLIESNIIGSQFAAKYTLKLLPDDFKKVNSLLKSSYEKSQINTDDFIHLKELSNAELQSILIDPSEWSIESEVVAKKILLERGVEISNTQIEEERKQIEDALLQGKRAHIGIQLAYFIAICVGMYFSLIFVIAGFAMGYYYGFGKTVNANGKRHYVYDKRSRLIGYFIIIIGFASIIVSLISNFS